MTISLISLDLPDFGIPKEQPTINAEIYKERLIKFRADLKNNQINFNFVSTKSFNFI